MQDWNELRIFAAIAAHRNLTRAAESLHLPKSSVSRALARLESRTRLTLVERSTRRVRLSAAGEALAAQTAEMARLADAGFASLATLEKQPRGRLRVSAPVTFLRSYLGPHIGQFLRRHPGIDLEILLPQPNLEADVYLGAAPRGAAKPVSASGHDEGQLLRVSLLTIPTGLYASARYLRQRPAPATPDDLKQHDVLGFSKRFEWQFARGRQQFAVTLQAKIVAPDPVLQTQLAQQDLGIALLNPFLVQGSSLVALLTDFATPATELTATYPRSAAALPKVSVFLAFLKQALAGLNESPGSARESPAAGRVRRAVSTPPSSPKYD